MNLSTEPVPLPPQPHRSSFSCDRHPEEQFTGFCPSCLCERLTSLDQSASAVASTSSRRPSTSSSSSAAAALKAIFNKIPSSSSSATFNAEPKPKPTKPSTSFFPELRRTKSFSATKNEGLGFSGVLFEPQRKSCDVRVRNTLSTLFNQDEENKSSKNQHQPDNIEARHSVSSCVAEPVLESKEEEEEEEPEYEDPEEELEEEPEEQENVDGDNEIRVLQERNAAIPNVVEETSGEIVEEIEDEGMKTIKDHIDLDSQPKKPSGVDLKEIAGSFWSAASVFSRTWHKWRRKQKLKKQRDLAALPVEKPISRQYRETQSEIADYGFGRRSCDTDPRFSLDAGRISFDDPRYSFDEPRASWDGYLVGRTFPRLPSMLSVVEDAPVVQVARTDTQIPVEEPKNSVNEEETVPGGSVQTREYYSDSSSRRRKSFDRSSSMRKNAATKDLFSNSLRDDCSETFELGFRDNASVIGHVDQKGLKKSRRWGWNIWGFIYRRGGGGNKDENEESCSRANGVERSLSESWQELRGEGNEEIGKVFDRKVFRSNSSVSSRNSYNNGGSFGSARKSSAEMNGNGRKKRDEFVLERNRSARYSPNDIDNGLLRFYLTPMRSSWKASSWKSKPNNSHSIARSVLRLY